jgi:hypothetical protein
MAKYLAEPFYKVRINKNKVVTFTHEGEFETDTKQEINVLDGLVPTWIKKLEKENKDENKKKEEKKQSAK